MKEVIIIGTGGHAKVVSEVVRASGAQIRGYVDDNREKGESFMGSTVLGGMSVLDSYRDHCLFIIALGSNAARSVIASQYSLPWYTAIHPSSVISSDAKIGEGTVIMPMAVINPCSEVGIHCIINTGAIIEHDNRIGDFVHLSPNAAVAGKVKIGHGTHLGIGTSVVDDVSISHNCVIGAGACVVATITEPGTYVGVPARKIHS